MLNCRNKKQIALILSVCAVIIAALICVIALASSEKKGREEIFVYEDYEYIILENGRLEIVSYSGKSNNINVPDAINGRSVYSIGEGVFRGMSITSVDVGSFTKKISAYAFAECASLKEVIMPDDIEHISEYAFFGTGIEEILLPETVKFIGEGAFANAAALKSVKIPKSVTSIEKLVFADCKSLVSAELHDAISNVGSGAFSGCRKLSEIKFSEGVSQIGERAFYGCAAISEVSLPKSLAEIGEDAFSRCSALEKISVAEGNERYLVADGALIDKSENALIILPEKSALTAFELPDYIVRIAPGAFYGCKALISVKIPVGALEIGEYAFYGCENLATVSISETVCKIGAFAFYNTKYYSSLSEEFAVVGDSVLLKYTPVRDSLNNLAETEYSKPISNGSKILGVAVTLPEGIKLSLRHSHTART